MNPARLEWRERAACLGEDTECYFPAGTSGPALDLIAHAKHVCAGCVVCSECLEYALATHQDDGIWGGLTEDERRSWRRQRARQAAQRPRTCSS